jgi:hypothetical protein
MANKMAYVACVVLFLFLAHYMTFGNTPQHHHRNHETKGSTHDLPTTETAVKADPPIISGDVFLSWLDRIKYATVWEKLARNYGGEWLGTHLAVQHNTYEATVAATWEGLDRVHMAGEEKLEGHMEGAQASFYSNVALQQARPQASILRPGAP